MKDIKKKLNNLRDGQILQVNFDSMGKEADDGESERVGIHPRGTETRSAHAPRSRALAHRACNGRFVRSRSVTHEPSPCFAFQTTWKAE